MLESCPELVSDCDLQGNTGLHWACSRGNFSLLKIILRHRPNLEIENKRGLTALALAIFNRHFLLVRELLAHGASPFLFAKNHMNPVDNDSCLAATRFMLKAYTAAAFWPEPLCHQHIQSARKLILTLSP
jgi:ankyrin repeat protein